MDSAATRAQAAEYFNSLKELMEPFTFQRVALKNAANAGVGTALSPRAM
jgi:hypothetical protein